MYTRILSSVLLFFLPLSCSVPPDRTPELNPDPSLLYAAHGQPGAWFNPWRPSNKRWTDLFRWAVSRSAYSGEWRDPPDVGRVDNDGSSFASPENSAAVTWVGHSTFAIHDAEDVFLTDPHFGKRALIPARLHPPGVPLGSIPADAFAVVSHNHYDQIRLSIHPGPTWFVPMGLRKKGENSHRARLVARGLNAFAVVSHNHSTILMRIRLRQEIRAQFTPDPYLEPSRSLFLCLTGARRVDRKNLAVGEGENRTIELDEVANRAARALAGHLRSGATFGRNASSNHETPPCGVAGSLPMPSGISSIISSPAIRAIFTALPRSARNSGPSMWPCCLLEPMRPAGSCTIPT